MKILVVFFCALASALLPLPCLAVDQPRAQHVFIISFDQGAPTSIQQSNMPLFKKMAAEGALTWDAFTIVPSLTLPSHTSMLTGVGIQKHQITWNDWQPQSGVVQVPTIFSLAKAKGLKTAMVVGKEKFKHLLIPGSVDTFLMPGNAKAVAAAFAATVAQQQPNVCFIHFEDPDRLGHQCGVGSPEQLAALADCDAALKTITDAITAAGMMSSSVIILTADHGGHNVSKNGHTAGTHGTAQPEDVTIPWIAWGKGVKRGYKITSSVVIYDTAATSLWLLGVPLPESFWGRPVVSAFE